MDRNYTILLGLILIMLGAFATSGGVLHVTLRKGSLKFMKIALAIMALGWAVLLIGLYVQDAPAPAPVLPPAQNAAPVAP